MAAEMCEAQEATRVQPAKLRTYLSPTPDLPGPVHIYALLNLSLLVKAFSCAEFSKTFNWGIFQITNKLSTDYMYYLIRYCAQFPVYRAKRRILTSISRYLTNMGMETNSTFALNTFR